MGLKNGLYFASVQIFLLATVAIQGLAPDSINLVTLRGLSVLCQVPVPLPMTEHDASEDEAFVCAPTGSTSSLEQLEILEGLSRLEMDTASRTRNLQAALRFLCKSPAHSARAGSRLCLAHCRLTC